MRLWHEQHRVRRETEGTHQVSSVVTDFSLGNVAWLKAPLSSPQLPTNEIMAACYAAMDPSSALWGRYMSEIDRLEKSGTGTPRDHELLRSSLRAREELMNLTLGSDVEFTDQTVPAILEKITAEIKGEEAEKRKAEAVLRSVVEAKLAVAETAIDRHRGRLADEARRFGRRWANAAFWAMSVAFAAVTFWQLIGPSFQWDWPLPLRVAVSVFLAAATAWSIYAGATGRTFIDYREGVEPSRGLEVSETEKPVRYSWRGGRVCRRGHGSARVLIFYKRRRGGVSPDLLRCRGGRRGSGR